MCDVFQGVYRWRSLVPVIFVLLFFLSGSGPAHGSPFSFSVTKVFRDDFRLKIPWKVDLPPNR